MYGILTLCSILFILPTVGRRRVPHSLQLRKNRRQSAVRSQRHQPQGIQTDPESSK